VPERQTTRERTRAVAEISENPPEFRAYEPLGNIGERPAAPLTLLIHLSDGTGESALYEDAGNGFAS